MSKTIRPRFQLAWPGDHFRPMRVGDWLTEPRSGESWRRDSPSRASWKVLAITGPPTITSIELRADTTNVDEIVVRIDPTLTDEALVPMLRHQGWRASIWYETECLAEFHRRTDRVQLAVVGDSGAAKTASRAMLDPAVIETAALATTAAGSVTALLDLSARLLRSRKKFGQDFSVMIKSHETGEFVALEVQADENQADLNKRMRAALKPRQRKTAAADPVELAALMGELLDDPDET